MKLWQSHTDDGLVTWLTEPPKIEDKPPPEHMSPEYAITLRHRSYNDRRKQALDSIVIRSPPLCKFLDSTIEHISTLYDEAEEGLVLAAPFRSLFWHLEAIEAAATDPKNQELAAAAQLLVEILHEEFRDLLMRRRTMIAAGEINFDTLWTIFKPGDTCIITFMSYPIAVKCVSIDFGRHAMGGMYYRIKYENLVWNGDSLGWSDDYTDILEYKGRRKIHTAQIIPLEYWSGSIDSLASRGQRFLDLVTKEPYMMRFNGESLDSESSPMWWWAGEQKKKMSERVILDARAYSHYFRRLQHTKWLDRNSLATQDLDQLHLAYLFPELHVFALQRKRWTRVWIDDVDEVVFNDAAYPSLVLPNDYKQLLLAFAEAQLDATRGPTSTSASPSHKKYHKNAAFDDVIAGKGQGILMLLAGPPGTGKTLTAEAMAEHMRLPLYSVSTGELGLASASGSIETELNKVLELSTRWNAVLLLDEADVFLEKRRDNADIQRNSIVSVFLRRLEYYRGIMFLTTNRIGSFDEAFRSRIHVAISYPDLDQGARRKIWKSFLGRVGESYGGGVQVGEEEVDELSGRRLNGREIRNIVKSAQLLASREGEALGKRHIDVVWRVEVENSPWKAAGGAGRDAGAGVAA